MSESTPLLPPRNDSHPTTETLSTIPAHLQLTEGSLVPNTLQRVHEFAAALTTYIELKTSRPTRGVVKSWITTREKQQQCLTVVDRAERLWNTILEEARSDTDLSNILWVAVPIQDGSDEKSRIIDLLVHPRCPDTLVTHPIVEIHARDVWKNGRPSSYVADSITDTVLSRYDGVATPFSVHLVDSLLQFAFAGLLLSYILDPPTLVVIDQGYLKNFGLRGVFLCIYSGSYLISKRTLQGIPFGILLLAFSMALPAVPMPGSGTFDLLLITFIFHVLLLHTPSLPTPLLLFRPQEVLPLAVLLWRSFTHTWLPILGFFLPVLFLATNLLSISLADVFLRQLALITAEIPQAPIETRAAFLTLYFLVLFIILTSLAMMVLVFSTTYLHTSSPNSTRWDRYGQPIGITARQTFIRSVIAYTSEPEHFYPFPTPINLAVWLLVGLPARIAHSSGWLSTDRLRQRGEQILWRGSIVPLTIIPTVTAWMLS